MINGERAIPNEKIKIIAHYYFKLKGIARKAINVNKYKRALTALESIADINYYFNQVYTDNAIENMLLFSVDKRIKVNNILSLIISPAIGGLIIAMICFLLKSTISNLYVKTIISVLGGVIVYGLLVMVMKNEFACELIDSIKKKIRR